MSSDDVGVSEYVLPNKKKCKLFESMDLVSIILIHYFALGVEYHKKSKDGANSDKILLKCK